MKALRALINAGRHIASSRCEAAARGEGSKLDAFLGSMALEAARVLLELREPDDAPTVLDMDVAADRGAAERFVELRIGSPVPQTFTCFPEQSEHGPN